MNLSPASVRAEIRRLEEYRAALPSKMQLLCSQLAEIGVAAAQGTVRSSMMGVAASIRAERNGEVGYIVIADDEEAAFLEFGTGVMGEGTYPGELPPEWGYDLRWTPQAHDPKHPEKWFYYDEENRRRWTWGLVADGFMFVGSETMRQMIVPIAKDVFR